MADTLRRMNWLLPEPLLIAAGVAALAPLHVRRFGVWSSKLQSPDQLVAERGS